MIDDTELEAIRSRIRNRISELGMSTRDTSIRSGMSPDALGKFLSGATRSIQLANLMAVAEALNASRSWLLGESVHNIQPDPKSQETEDDSSGVRFGGIVEAGAWRLNDDLNQDASFQVIQIPFDPRYGRSEQYAFEVVGDSMTEAGVFEGMYVLAVDIYAWQRAHGEPRDGKLVVVARTRNGNPERELTVKQLRIFRDRIELHPQSRNPNGNLLFFPTRRAKMKRPRPRLSLLS